MRAARYTLPDPKCNHSVKNRMVRVLAGYEHSGPYASADVCEREECIKDAQAWAYASTHQEPYVTYCWPLDNMRSVC